MNPRHIIHVSGSSSQIDLKLVSLKYENHFFLRERTLISYEKVEKLNFANFPSLFIQEVMNLQKVACARTSDRKKAKRVN